MEAGWRGQLLLGGIGAIAVANTFLLSLTMYALLAAALHVLGSHAPAPVYAFLAGAAGAAALLGVAFKRERQLREGDYGTWPGTHASAPDPDLSERLRRLADSASLPTPALRQIESETGNAFAAGRSREDASIVVTDGLLELGETERDAVLAHELAHIEAEDIRTIGLADAIATTLRDLGRARDSVLWGPRQIAIDILPFAAVLVGGWILIWLYVEINPGQSVSLLGFLIALAALGFFVAWLRTLFQNALISWRGLVQLFLVVFFFGPLTVVEWVLAPPTAAAMARLLSRTRVYEADRRAAELIGGPEALISALRSLEPVELRAGEGWAGALRFSLFVTPRARSGYRAWLERITSTHPSAADRIEALTAVGEDARTLPAGGRD